MEKDVHSIFIEIVLIVHIVHNQVQLLAQLDLSVGINGVSTNRLICPSQGAARAAH